MIATDIEYLQSLINKAPTTPPRPLISEYIEDKRILPPGTPFPGYWSNSRTPYAVEIMDNMSPYSPIQHTVCMKGAQLGLTAAAENVIAYWMDECPGPILMLSATDALLGKWSSKRLEPLIDSCGYRHKIVAFSENSKSRSSGDKMFSKTYIGGFLEMASAQSPASQRSDSVRVLIRDEIDGAPKMLVTGEGNWLEVSAARTRAWDARKKIFDFTTPVSIEDSNIYPLYLEGDQRKYAVPCPHCGKEQFLEWGSEKKSSGMRGDYVGGVLKNAYYLCDHCHDAIFNYHKTEMLNRGRWLPTAETTDDVLRSYQIGSQYSPVGMYSWKDMWKDYDKSKRSPDGSRSFQTLALGMPFKDQGYRPKIENVINLTGDYQEGEIPDGVMWLTAGIDVQRGSKKSEKNPPRLEMEIVGHGAGFRTWSILYRRFEGSIDNPAAGAWEELNEFAREGGLTYKRKDGREFPVNLIFIDSGDGETTATVYQFCQSWGNTYPSKGYNALKTRKKEKKDGGDEAGPRDFRRYRAAKIGEGNQFLYEISTNYYKNHIYNNLNITRNEDEDRQRPGFCAFPMGRSQEYFAMLTAEEKRSDGSFHSGGRRNEALDCRCYAMCASDVFLDSKVRDYQLAAKKAGATPVQVQQVNHKWVLDLMEKEMRVKVLQPVG